MASDEDLKAEIERLRAENEALKKREVDVAKGERERWPVRILAGALSRHALQGAVGKTPGDG